MAEVTQTGEKIEHVHQEGITADLLAARGGFRGMEDDVRRCLREDAPCGLTGTADASITVTYTVRAEDGFHEYRGAAWCAEPGCVAFERENAWVQALHRLLDTDPGRDLSWSDPLDHAFAQFEGVYWWAARHPTPERLERAAHWRPELARLVAERFPDLPPLVPATGGGR
ncbi:hypothetical protein [Streptomyces sp. HUAS TT7]|uniref:hypothetical protein n=1 Tax=Streptomyces sp. HUAS TT7 TaxID=3447507 RepID=UPI003F65AEF8